LRVEQIALQQRRVKQTAGQNRHLQNLLQRFKAKASKAAMQSYRAGPHGENRAACWPSRLSPRVQEPANLPNPMLRDATPTLATLRLTRLKAATDRGLCKTSAISAGRPAIGTGAK
jgi:hypothetical protein